jgi:hypothetical protein
LLSNISKGTLFLECLFISIVRSRLLKSPCKWSIFIFPLFFYCQSRRRELNPSRTAAPKLHTKGEAP